MHDLGLSDLSQLSYWIRSGTTDHPRSPIWVGVYRELVESATLYSTLKNKDFGIDTIVVFDGLLRSDVFSGDSFQQYLQLLSRCAEDHNGGKNRRKVFVVWVAKHSKVLDRYRLAMSVDGVLTRNYPAYVEVPSAIEHRAYEKVTARGDDFERRRERAGRYVGGKMFLVK